MLKFVILLCKHCQIIDSKFLICDRCTNTGALRGVLNLPKKYIGTFLKIFSNEQIKTNLSQISLNGASLLISLWVSFRFFKIIINNNNNNKRVFRWRRKTLLLFFSPFSFILFFLFMHICVDDFLKKAGYIFFKFWLHLENVT